MFAEVRKHLALILDLNLVYTRYINTVPTAQRRTSAMSFLFFVRMGNAPYQISLNILF